MVNFLKKLFDRICSFPVEFREIRFQVAILSETIFDLLSYLLHTSATIPYCRFDNHIVDLYLKKLAHTDFYINVRFSIKYAGFTSPASTVKYGFLQSALPSKSFSTRNKYSGIFWHHFKYLTLLLVRMKTQQSSVTEQADLTN